MKERAELLRAPVRTKARNQSQGRRSQSGFPKIFLLAFAVIAFLDCRAVSQGWLRESTPTTRASSEQEAPRTREAMAFDQIVDQVIQRESDFVSTIRNFSPLVETYIQNLKPDAE